MSDEEKKVETPANPDPPKVEEKPKKDWWTGRISELSAQRDQLKEENAVEKAARQALEEENRQLKSKDKLKKPTETATKVNTEKYKEDVIKAASVIAGENTFAQNLERIYNDGNVKFKDWDAKLEQLKAVGDPEKLRGLYTILKDFEAPAELIHKIASDPSLAKSLLSGSTVTVIRKLTIMEEEIKNAREIEENEEEDEVKPTASKLQTGGKGKGKVDLYDTKGVSKEDWLKERRANRRMKIRRYS